MKPVSLEVEVVGSVSNARADAMMLLLALDAKESQKPDQVAKNLPAWIKSDFLALAQKRKYNAKAGSAFIFDAPDGLRKSLLCIDSKSSLFEMLTIARKNIDAAIFDAKVKSLVVDLSHIGARADDFSDALISAAAAKLYKFPKYKTISKDKTKADSDDDLNDLSVTFVVGKPRIPAVEAATIKAMNATTSGTNLVRWLAKRAGNDLTCKAYVDYLRSLAKERRWIFKHHDHDALTKMKAGAFLAVVRGSEHRDYGIIELTYTPKSKSAKHLALVGKGMMFDTGGHCLKPSAYMLGMHGDMAGSAVALAVLNVAALESWPVKVTAYLAVADNMLGPKSYKPNDVVTSMKGTTIEIIDTDAEGRMVLADTLHLASQKKPALIMDFATLTGACMRAIGTTYSGVFTNREELHGDLIKAGKKSGERVWPFPMDRDFVECLESTVADFKQCREKGGVDHIEASQFLMHFAGDHSPWVHVDLSAIEHSGGLAHVPTEETGFGVRFATTFLRDYFGIKG